MHPNSGAKSPTTRLLKLFAAYDNIMITTSECPPNVVCCKTAHHEQADSMRIRYNHDGCIHKLIGMVARKNDGTMFRDVLLAQYFHGGEEYGQDRL
jgi:hypothetical protein